MFADPWNTLVCFLLDPTCPACRQPLPTPLKRPVCDRCWRSIRPVDTPACAQCGDPWPAWRGSADVCARCRRQPPSFSRAASGGRYDGALRELIHAFKFERRRLLARPLGDLMVGAGREVLAGADAVVPVPLHVARSLRRGFNQADDLARELGWPVWRLLRRRRGGPPQSSIVGASRRRHLRGAFALSRRASIAPGLRRRMRGATLVLIDDVMTTGATLDACGRVLRAAGAADVRALTVARTVTAPRRPPPA